MPLQVAPSVLLSPVLLGIITAYQTGCYEDMRAFASVKSPLVAIAIILRSRILWENDNLLHVDPFNSFDPVVTAWYAQVGLSRLTKLFACMPRMRDIVVAHAVYSGNMSVLAQLPVDVVRAVEIPLLDLAAVRGHMDVLKHLHADVGHNGCTAWAVDSAALQGHGNIVAYLLANRREGISMLAIQGSASRGHLDILKMIQAHYARMPLHPFHWALEAAASFNQFEVVAYILDLLGPAERYSTKVMDEAAGNGHLEMVQFLHERNFKYTTNAMVSAAANNHLDVVKWLQENRAKGCTEDILGRAAYHGHKEELLQCLRQQRKDGCT